MLPQVYSVLKVCLISMNIISPLLTMTYAPLNFKCIRLAGVLVEFHTSVPVSAFILSLSFQFRTTKPISDISI